MLRNAESLLELAGGVLPPVITCFDATERLCIEQVEENVARLHSEGLRGFVALGSNSEAVHLDISEQRSVIKAVRSSAGSTSVMLAGVWAQSVRETIQLCREMADLGADGALVITPSFYISDGQDARLVRYYTEVADASPIPIFIYNVPKFTGVSMSCDLVAKVAIHDNIWGIKDSSGNVECCVDLLSLKPGFVPMVGTAGAFLSGLRRGMLTGVMALANSHAAELMRLSQAWRTGQRLEAESIHNALMPVNEAVTSRYGVAGLKFVCELRGYNGGLPRRPLQPLSTEEAAELARVVKASDRQLSQFTAPR